MAPQAHSNIQMGLSTYDTAAGNMSNVGTGTVNHASSSTINRWRRLSDEQKRIIREKNRLRVAQKRATLDPQEKIRRLELERQKAATRRLTESPMHRELRKEKQRFRAALRRRNETPEQRELRLKIGREKASERRRNESPSSRERRLKAGRERVAMRRSSRRESPILADDGIGALTFVGAPLTTILEPSLSRYG